MYELKADLKLFFGLIFNAIVLDIAIDAGLPTVCTSVFVVLIGAQYTLRRPIAKGYAEQKRTTNRMTAHTDTAWNNITNGNRCSCSLWRA